MHREDGCSAAPGSAGANTARLGQQPGPGGAAGMGVRRARQVQSSPPTSSQGAGGARRPLAGAAAAGTASSRKPPPWMGSPNTCTSGLACTPTLPSHSPSNSPRTRAVSRLKSEGGGATSPSKTPVTCLSLGAQQSPQGPICSSCPRHTARYPILTPRNTPTSPHCSPSRAPRTWSDTRLSTFQRTEQEPVLPSPLPLSLPQRNKPPQSRWASALAEGPGGDSPSAAPPAIPRR